MKVRFLPILGVILLQASPAFAQWVCPESNSPQQARRLAGETFNDGERLFTERRFQDAVDRFECSYSLVRHPNTLYNIARTAAEAGNLALALQTYRSYLERHATDDDRSTVQAAIRDVENRIAAQERQPPDQPPPVGEGGGDPQQPPPPRNGGETGGTRMTSARIAAWVTMALGVALAGTGGGLWLAAWSSADDFPSSVASQDELSTWQEELDRGEAMETASYVLMGVGAASIAASIVLFAVFPGSEPVASGSRSRPLLGFHVGEGSLALSFSGRF